MPCSCASRIAEVIRDGHPEPYAFDGARLRIGSAPLSSGFGQRARWLFDGYKGLLAVLVGLGLGA